MREGKSLSVMTQWKLIGGGLADLNGYKKSGVV